MVGANGFEPSTSWSRRRRYKTSKCRIWCRLRDSATIYPALEVDGSWTEILAAKISRAITGQEMNDGMPPLVHPLCNFESFSNSSVLSHVRRVFQLKYRRPSEVLKRTGCITPSTPVSDDVPGVRNGKLTPP